MIPSQVLIVLPDGSACKLGEDIRRARYRNSFFRNELLKPDQVLDSVRVQLDGSQDSGRCPAAAHDRSPEFAQLPEELQHRRSNGLREPGGCSSCKYQDFS